MFIKKKGQWQNEGANIDIVRIAIQELVNRGILSSLPSGGTTNQVLTKNSNNDNDATWKDAPVALPNGGNAGQILAKTSDQDGDANWIDNSSSTDNCVKYDELKSIDGDIPTTEQIADYLNMIKSNFLVVEQLSPIDFDSILERLDRIETQLGIK